MGRTCSKHEVNEESYILIHKPLIKEPDLETQTQIDE